MIQQSQTYTLTFLVVLSADHVSPATGKTVTVNLSKAGGAFAAAAGAVSEIGNGWYKGPLTAADTNALGDLAVNATATACDPRDFREQIVAFAPTDGVRLGLTALPNAAAAASGGLPVLGPTGGVLAMGTAAAVAAGSITLATGDGAKVPNNSIVVILTATTGAGQNRYVASVAGDRRRDRPELGRDADRHRYVPGARCPPRHGRGPGRARPPRRRRLEPGGDRRLHHGPGGEARQPRRDHT